MWNRGDNFVACVECDSTERMSPWTTLTAGSLCGAAMRTHSPARLRSNDAVGCDGVAGGEVRSETEHSGWGEAPRHSRAWGKGERMSVAGAEGVFGGTGARRAARSASTARDRG